MCGIFGYVLGDLSTKLSNNKQLLENINANFQKIQHRGPDTTKTLIRNNVFLGFHRLRIMDLSEKGDQPFNIPNYKHLYLVCK